MKLGVPKELVPGERRVALIPETVGRLGDGVEVVVEPGAGEAAGFSDEAYREAGAAIGDPWGADVVAKVAAPTAEEAARLHSGQVLIAFLAPLTDSPVSRGLAAAGVHAFALESVPRITRAQPMDALSSQATVGRLQGGVDRGRPVVALLPDVDDGGRDDPAGEGAGAGSRCGRAAGDRDGAATRRGRARRSTCAPQCGSRSSRSVRPSSISAFTARRRRVVTRAS